jgi:putative hydrolase of the HAD superfamily
MKVICWDFDGTLVYSDHLWSNSVFRALNETVINHNIVFADIRRCMATGFTWQTPFEDYSKMTGEKWWDFMNRHFYNSYISLGIEPDLAKVATNKVRTIIKETKNYNLYPDTISALEAAREKGCKNVLLSNNYPDLIDVLDALDLTKYFDHLIISALVGYDKPRSEIFKMAKNLYPDGEYIMVGDNPHADVEGGKAADMKTVLVHKGDCAEADYCFDDLMSVLDVEI